MDALAARKVATLSNLSAETVSRQGFTFLDSCLRRPEHQTTLLETESSPVKAVRNVQFFQRLAAGIDLIKSVAPGYLDQCESQLRYLPLQTLLTIRLLQPELPNTPESLQKHVRFIEAIEQAIQTKLVEYVATITAGSAEDSHRSSVLCRECSADPLLRLLLMRPGTSPNSRQQAYQSHAAAALLTSTKRRLGLELVTTIGVAAALPTKSQKKGGFSVDTKASGTPSKLNGWWRFVFPISTQLLPHSTTPPVEPQAKSSAIDTGVSSPRQQSWNKQQPARIPGLPPRPPSGGEVKRIGRLGRAILPGILDSSASVSSSCLNDRSRASNRPLSVDSHYPGRSLAVTRSQSADAINRELLKAGTHLLDVFLKLPELYITTLRPPDTVVYLCQNADWVECQTLGSSTSACVSGGLSRTQRRSTMYVFELPPGGSLDRFVRPTDAARALRRELHGALLSRAATADSQRLVGLCESSCTNADRNSTSSPPVPTFSLECNTSPDNVRPTPDQKEVRQEDAESIEERERTTSTATSTCTLLPTSGRLSARTDAAVSDPERVPIRSVSRVHTCEGNRGNEMGPIKSAAVRLTSTHVTDVHCVRQASCIETFTGARSNLNPHTPEHNVASVSQRPPSRTPCIRDARVSKNGNEAQDRSTFRSRSRESSVVRKTVELCGNTPVLRHSRLSPLDHQRHRSSSERTANHSFDHVRARQGAADRDNGLLDGFSSTKVINQPRSSAILSPAPFTERQLQNNEKVRIRHCARTGTPISFDRAAMVNRRSNESPAMCAAASTPCSTARRRSVSTQQHLLPLETRTPDAKHPHHPLLTTPTQNLRSCSTVRCSTNQGQLDLVHGRQKQPHSPPSSVATHNPLNRNVMSHQNRQPCPQPSGPFGADFCKPQELQPSATPILPLKPLQRHHAPASRHESPSFTPESLRTPPLNVNRTPVHSRGRVTTVQDRFITRQERIPSATTSRSRIRQEPGAGSPLRSSLIKTKPPAAHAASSPGTVKHTLRGTSLLNTAPREVPLNDASCAFRVLDRPALSSQNTQQVPSNQNQSTSIRRLVSPQHSFSGRNLRGSQQSMGKISSNHLSRTTKSAAVDEQQDKDLSPATTLPYHSFRWATGARTLMNIVFNTPESGTSGPAAP